MAATTRNNTLLQRLIGAAALGLVGVFSYLGAAVQENVSGALIQKSMTTVDGVKHSDFSQPILC